MIKNNTNNLTDIHIIKQPIITDKTIRLLDNNKYSFLVHRKSNKPSIKSAIENLFNVKVINVNTCQLPKKKKKVGKYIGYKSQYKKAIVKLQEDDTINLFETT